MTIKVRKKWKIKPIERIKTTKKIYNRREDKKILVRIKKGEFDEL